MSKDIYEVITDKRSIPFNESGTGTIATFGLAVVGTGTAFLTEMQAGSYLVDLTQWEFRRVIRVDSDTQAYLSEAFTSNIAAGTTPEIIKKQFASPSEVSIKIPSSEPDGLLDNKTFSGILTKSKSSLDRSSQWDRIGPWIVDATGTEMRINIIY